jgi:hypothetical protein
MMARFRLIGEGPDDVAVFVALVKRYSLPLADRDKEAPDKLLIDCPGGDAAVLRALRDLGDEEDQRLIEHVRTLLKTRDLTAEDRFGIVVDADHPKAADPDDGFRRRWVQLKENLRILGYSDVPDDPDPTGTIVGTNQADRPWVGVWMMPDNRSPGKLEDFARRLVRSGDETLWDYASQTTSGSSSQGAKFAPKDYIKAHVHTFLAWQDVPGVPMGLAITKQFLDADSAGARDFVSWLCRLYGLTRPKFASP